MIHPIAQARHARLYERIVSLARMLGCDPAMVRDWYHHDPIQGLDGMTAAQLVQQGQGERIVAFLRAIMVHEQAESRR